MSPFLPLFLGTFALFVIVLVWSVRDRKRERQAGKSGANTSVSSHTAATIVDAITKDAAVSEEVIKRATRAEPHTEQRS